MHRMKTDSILAALGVVLIVAVLVAYNNRKAEKVAPLPSPTVSVSASWLACEPLCSNRPYRPSP